MEPFNTIHILFEIALAVIVFPKTESKPPAYPEKFRLPVPTAEYVQVKTAVPVGPIFALKGAGPEIFIAVPVPNKTKLEGATRSDPVAPLFVTVIVTVNESFKKTNPGRDIDAVRLAPAI
jgi:hypothetical protein